MNLSKKWCLPGLAMVAVCLGTALKTQAQTRYGSDNDLVVEDGTLVFTLVSDGK